MKSEVVTGFETPFRSRVELIRKTFSSSSKASGPRVAILTGLHGDELEGLYVIHKTLRFLSELEQSQPDSFLGDVHFYPATNPPALNHTSRLWPGHGIDLNRTFGKKRADSLPSEWSGRLLEDVKRHTDIAVDLHASNLHLRELPQVRVIDEFTKSVLPLALHTNTDLIWTHAMAGLFASTFGYALNQIKIPTLVIEAGICLRVTREYGNQVFAGLINLLKQTGVLAEEVAVPGRIKQPQVIRANQGGSILAKHSGLFVSETQVGDFVGESRALGHVIDPMSGQVLEEIVSPDAGLLFTLRENPVVYTGSLLGRIALEKEPPP